MNSHLSIFPTICRFQSAYRKFHSCETALLRIHNDISLAINHQKVTALVLLDLSAAFDTIDHSILLSRLHSTYGLTGNALALLSSYLSNRFQKVTINNNSSEPLPLTTGVPQGSVLGTLLYLLFTPLQLVKSLLALISHSIYMPMIRNFTFLFPALIQQVLSTLSQPVLTLSILGLL